MDLDNNKKETQTEKELVEAYLNQLELDTPDLWDRIEAGLDAEEYQNADQAADQNAVMNAKETVQEIKAGKKPKRMAGWIAAAVSLAAVLLAAILVVPFLSHSGRMDKTEDSGRNEVMPDEELVQSQDSAKNESNSDGVDFGNAESNGEEIENSDGLEHDSLTEAAEENASVNGIQPEGIVCTLEILSRTEENCHCRIISIEENSFALSAGTEIEIICMDGTVEAAQGSVLTALLIEKQENGKYLVAIQRPEE